MKDRLKDNIWTLLQEKGGRAVIAIDGMAASGKSTLAARLAEELDGCVIHMDDFFSLQSSEHRRGYLPRRQRPLREI